MFQMLSRSSINLSRSLLCGSRRCFVTTKQLLDASNAARHNFFDVKLSPEAEEALKEERVADECDILIVGGGPAGLSAAIRAKQEAPDLRVVLLEKGAEIGRHTLSGAVIEPSGLVNLLGEDWKEMGVPLNTECSSDVMYYLANENLKVRLPEIPTLHNRGNYIGSLGAVCRFLGEHAEGLGVEIFPGFAGASLVLAEDGSVKGVATPDVGIGRDGSLKPGFERGMELHGKVTILAEGCRGSLTQEVEKRFNLRDDKSFQTYGIGLKEVWRVDPSVHQLGLTAHTVGWPISNDTWGGAFMYHWDENLVSVGYVVGLDYTNPHLNPYKTFQKWKTHKYIRSILETGECISYGARALNEGGFQSIPKLVFPGGALAGCNAGFLNVPKVKGTHNAMKTGIMAASAAVEAIGKGEHEKGPIVLDNYVKAVESSEVWEEMYAVRNIRPSFTSPLGNWGGFVYSALEGFILRGRGGWTFKHKHKDNESLKPASECPEIEYPKPDNKLTFDLLTNVARTGTNHEEDQPSHLRCAHPEKSVSINLKKYAGPEAKFCPAGVYEYVDDESAPEGKRLNINAQNCIHCKTCSIKWVKEGDQNLRWTVPTGVGDGPAYENM